MIVMSEENNTKCIEQWDELDISIEILRGIYAYGFETPSPIQKKAITPILAKKDLIAQAQSGTGKTGCFTVGALSVVDTSITQLQVILLSPTRELASQTKLVLDTIGTFVKGLQTQLLVGGTSTENCIRSLSEEPPHIVVGCPGRVYDMLRRKKIHSETLKLIVLDEADEMLSYGFKEQVYNIFQFMPNEIQVALFSATLPNEIHTLTDKFMRNPVKVLVKSDSLTLEGISQYYVAIENDEQKIDCLKDIFEAFSMSQCIIYCNSIPRVQKLYEDMIKDNFPVGHIHSNMDKEERAQNFENFKKGITRVLISSNVTARGIDVQQVSTVINFDLPSCVHTYLHRIGRSGRWGRKGIGMNFVTRRDNYKLKEIEQHYSTEIVKMPDNWSDVLISM